VFHIFLTGLNRSNLFNCNQMIASLKAIKGVGVLQIQIRSLHQIKDKRVIQEGHPPAPAGA